MAKTAHHQIADRLYLIHQTPDQKPVVQNVPQAVNHLVVIDCSGSMSGELPAIREQLKRKLPKMLAEQDTLSIIWFSGRSECGTLLENEPVSTLADLKDVERAIDRWLKPVGLTGFRDPMLEVQNVVERISQKRPDSVFSLFFMSDGCDNQWSRQDILGAVEKASGHLASSTFVEYGYYADRPTLTAMAERAGGTLIFAKDFDAYEPVFEAAMAKRILGGKRVEMEVRGDAVGGFVWGQVDGSLVTFEVKAGKVLVPEALPGIWFLNPTATGDAQESIGELAGSQPAHEAVGAAFAALSLYAVRMKPDVVLSLLRATGDVAFVEEFGGLFGKQAYSKFMDAAKDAAFDAGKRFQKGRDTTKVPRDDAFTVLDFLRELVSSDDNRVLLDHSAFQYQRISRAKVDATQVLTDAEQAEVARLSAELATTKDAKKIAELAQQIAALSAKGEALSFKADAAPNGYSVAHLTYNEERPNVSILVKKNGTVDLTSRNPAHEIPTTFQTFVYRNYAVVKDGIVNVKVLPCLLTDLTRAKLAEAIESGRAPHDFVSFSYEDARQVALIHLDRLPVINRRMVKEISAKSFFERQYSLLKHQAAYKVYNAILKEQFPGKKSDGFAALYGEDGAAWLKEQGFTEYSGFSPKSVAAESTDFYMSKELKVSLKGLSTLPTLKLARENIQKGKINAPTALMQTALKAVDAYQESDTYKTSSVQPLLLETWLNQQAAEAGRHSKALQREIAEDIFSLIVGQTWFKEFSSLDENTMTLPVDGTTVECKAEMREVEVKI